MKLKPFSLVPTLLLTASLVLPAKDQADIAIPEKTYVFSSKGHLPKVGSVLEDSQSMSMKGAKMQLNIQGQLMEGAMTMKEQEVEKYEILAADKIRYTLMSKASDHKMVFMDQPMPIPAEPAPLVEKPVLLTKKDGSWTGVLEKGEASKTEQEKIEVIAKLLTLDADFKVYGDQPRKIGDEWEVEASDVLGDDELAGKVTMKFTKIEMFKGDKCAVFESQMKMSGEVAGMDGANLKMEGKLVIHRSLADKVDVSTKMDGTMSIIGKMEPQPGMAFDMKVKGPLAITQTIQLTKAK